MQASNIAPRTTIWRGESIDALQPGPRNCAPVISDANFAAIGNIGVWDVPEGRLTPAQLKNTFRSGTDGPGLLLVGGQWVSPETVLRGPAIFGERRSFAPHVDGLDPLWAMLGVTERERAI